MKTILSCVLVCLAVISLHPQANNKVFEKYLPQNVFLDKENGGAIVENINKYAKLNPELIYYYLAYIDKYVARGDHDPRSNYLYMFRAKVNSIAILKEKWLKKDIYKYFINPDYNLIRKRIDDVDKGILEVPEYKTEGNVPPLFVDTNKVYFYSYIYYTQDNATEYNEKTDYYGLLQPILLKNRNLIIEEINKLKQKNKNEYRASLSNIFANWYLIDSDFEYKLGINTGGGSFKKLIESLPNAYVIKPELHISAGYTPFRVMDITYDKNKFSDPLKVEDTFLYEFTIPVQIKAKSAFFAGVGISWPIMESKKNFCYIKMRLNYAYIKNDMYQPAKDTNIIYQQTVYTPQAKRYLSTYHINEIKNVKNDVFFMELVTPFFLIRRSVFLEAGVQLRYSMLRYEYSVHRTISNWKYNQTTLLSETDLYKTIKDNSFKVYPVASLNWSFLKYANLFVRSVFLQKIICAPTFGLEVNYEM